MEGLERLHYFDGQRLVARDLELEQKYHMRVRRLLNRGLYSPGVVNGLEVSVVDPRHVRVSHGMALDRRGREVILLTDTTLTVPSRLPSSPLGGYFLVMQYSEEKEPGTLADCREGAGTTPPARIREAPALSWTETWPNQQACGEKGHASDCAVVLALVILDSSCQVQKIEPGVRQYAHSALPGQVHPFALEGEKDIDSVNPKVLHFQIRGGPPDAVLLYLWADAISSLLYTELGSHSHGIGSVTTGTTTTNLGSHTHKVDDLQADANGTHDHQIRVAGITSDLAGAIIGILDPFAAPVVALLQGTLGNPNTNDAILTAPFMGLLGSAGRVARGPQTHQGDSNFDYIQPDGQHGHKVPGPTTHAPDPNQSSPHSHTTSGSVSLGGNTAPTTGSTLYQARDGQPAYSYFSNLQVKLDGTDVTGLIKTRLGWAQLGDGTATHQLVTSGTGAIDLVQLGLPLGVGPHRLELRLNSGGGKVLYNLYVE
jgi:hypothetical protein